jgi:hypothetical protein
LPKDNSSDILEIYRTGSPLYMATEIKKLEKDERAMIDGCKADIYSLGISIIKLTTPTRKTLEHTLLFYNEQVNDE